MPRNIDIFWSTNQFSSGKSLLNNGLIFRQDNDPKNAALKVKSYLE